MTARSYLSIGDVLTLLRQEFPDVTISKIRFLESQGLVDPERTPSGYRKFYQHDVDRLRWVLLQQREHFLPLKVIKDRLDDEPDTVSSEMAAHAVAPAAGHSESVLVGQRAAQVNDGPSAIGILAGDDAALPGLDATPAAAMATMIGGRPSGDETPADAVSGSGSDSGSVSGGGRAPSAPTVSSRTSLVAEAHAGRSAAPVPESGGGVEATPATPATPASSSTGKARSRPQRATASSSTGARATRGGGSRRRSPRGSGGLSTEDLAEASGLPVEVVCELVSYGLLAPTTVAGFDSYDEVDLAIAKLAGRLATFGIEPRHLRLYKNAAEREAGFVEQVVLPLVRQRNPDAQARAEATADDLVSLGQELRGALLQRALGGLLHR